MRKNHFSSSQARVTSPKSLTFVAFPTSHNTFPFIWSFQTIQNHFSSSQARVTSPKSLTFVAFPTSHNTFPFIWSFQTIQNHFSSSQARVTSPKSLTFVAFPTHTVFNLNLIHSIFTSWNNVVQFLASWVRLTLVRQIANIAWMSFDLQEHKIHNNASLVMEHLSLLWSNYQEYIKYQNPHMWGENVRKGNYQCS